ncbi:MAG: ATP-binding cassette domain-containing protein [Propionibacteriaceae bacterium]|nr:ATP-binding cassette domain-containing protein [Propionibacteriaceae bacterium]
MSGTDVVNGISVGSGMSVARAVSTPAGPVAPEVVTPDGVVAPGGLAQDGLGTRVKAVAPVEVVAQDGLGTPVKAVAPDDVAAPGGLVRPEGLVAQGVRVSFDGRIVLDGVSMSLPRGRTMGLVGPSGIGKSTLARVLAGLLVPQAGTVTHDGAPVVTRRGRMSNRIGMLFQSPRRSCNPQQRLGELIAEPLRYRPRGEPRTPRSAHAARVAEVAAEVGLTTDLLGRLPAEVSDGQLQRAALARALVTDPAYLICDEATAMLDALTTASIVAVLRRRTEAGLGVLAISHDRELLDAWADDIIELGGPASASSVNTAA